MHSESTTVDFTSPPRDPVDRNGASRDFAGDLDAFAGKFVELGAISFERVDLSATDERVLRPPFSHIRACILPGLHPSIMCWAPHIESLTVPVSVWLDCAKRPSRAEGEEP